MELKEVKTPSPAISELRRVLGQMPYLVTLYPKELEKSQMIFRNFLIISLLFLFISFSVFCSSASAISLPTNTYNQEESGLERSNYDLARKVLSASKFVDRTIGKMSPPPLGTTIQIGSKVVQGGIYVEDWVHTDKEIEGRINDVLGSEKLMNASKNPEVYSQFEKYVKNSLKNWVPDRDYPQIGYLPKELLYDESLGDKEITKYWPEANKKDQATYNALTADELVLNYELVWQDLLKNSKKSPKP